jgi:hypothetical protein
VKTVTTGDEIALDFVRNAVLEITDARPNCLVVVEADVECLVNRLLPCSGSCVDEIPGHLGLTVDAGALPLELLQVESVPSTAKAQAETAELQALRVEALTDVRSVEHLDRPGFENSCTDAAEDVLDGAMLEDDRIDARTVEQLAEQQSRWARTDDGDLNAHALSMAQLPLGGKLRIQFSRS